MKPRGPDAKPRQRAAPPARISGRVKLKALKTLDAVIPSGRLVLADRRPSGQGSGVVFGCIAPLGGVLLSPAVDFARSLRKRMRPITIAPTTIRDASGQVIATITVDPVTGKRTRTPA